MSSFLLPIPLTNAETSMVTLPGHEQPVGQTAGAWDTSKGRGCAGVLPAHKKLLPAKPQQGLSAYKYAHLIKGCFNYPRLLKFPNREMISTSTLF